jgi:hypothetical protein
MTQSRTDFEGLSRAQRADLASLIKSAQHGSTGGQGRDVPVALK